ncbi:MAG: DUF4190 domain-containing protein [Planctomycetota bacterium]
MKKYYVVTKSGKKGPFPADRIAAGVKRGDIPPHARLEESLTGNLLTAQQAVDSYQHRQTGRIQDSDRQAPAPSQPPQHAQPQPGVFENRPFPQVNSNLVSPTGQPAAHSPNYPPSPTAQPQYPSHAYPQQQQRQPYPAQHAAPAGFQQAYPQQQPHPQQGPSPYGHGQQPYYRAPQTSGLAIAALVLSLATIFTCLPTCIGGVICGTMALKDCQPSGPKQGRGMALAGIWLGAGLGVIYLGFIFLIVLAETNSL